jgi:hypothetical protein
LESLKGICDLLKLYLAPKSCIKQIVQMKAFYYLFQLEQAY